MLGIRPIAKRISSASSSLPSSRITRVVPSPSAALQLRDRDSGPHLDARLDEPAANVLADERLHSGKQCRPRQQCHRRAETAPGGGHLDADAAGPDHGQAGGTVLLSVALRLVQGFASATPGMSGTVAVLPVQTTTAWRAVRTTSRSSAVATTTRRGPSMRAWPRISSAPMATTASACPLSFQLVT